MRHDIKISLKETLFIFALILAFFNGCTEKPEKVYRVGIISGVDFFNDTAEGFKIQMTEFGYMEGKNIAYEFRKINVDHAAERRILQKFVDDRVDLILTFPTEVSLTAKEVTKGTNIPVVFANANIEGVDLVHSVREPGGNITGVRYPGPDLAIKRFEILLEFAPHVKKIWVPYMQGYPIIIGQLDVLRPVAESLGITLIEVPTKGPADIRADLDRRERSGDMDMDAILMIADPLVVNPEAFEVFGKFAAKHKIPVGGALMSVDGYHSIFGVSTKNVFVGRQAAYMADKIFKGTPAGLIPVVSAESYLDINYRAARELGLEVSEGLLSRADRIIR